MRHIRPASCSAGAAWIIPFETLYIADLDAIQKHGDHFETVAKLRAAMPHVDIWIDAGIASIEDSARWLELGLDCVIGSESQPDVETVRQLIEKIGMERMLLSLDFVAGQPKGPAELFVDTRFWPQRMIAMTLGRVGSYAGPDVDLLESLRQRADGHRIYAAGGVRDISDLEKLKSMGIAGALLASALHDAEVTSEQIANLEK